MTFLYLFFLSVAATIGGLVGLSGMRCGFVDGDALPDIEHEKDKASITPKGHLYEQCLIEKIKPFIDGMFRTTP
ncbi:hypothetical protein D3C74_305230 [compost metagenome]